MFDRCKGTANPPNRQILIEFFMQKNLPWGQVPGSNNRAMAARYLSPGIMKLTLLLHPIQHIMLLKPMLRRIAMIGFNKIHHLLIA